MVSVCVDFRACNCRANRYLIIFELVVVAIRTELIARVAACFAKVSRCAAVCLEAHKLCLASEERVACYAEAYKVSALVGYVRVTCVVEVSVIRAVVNYNLILACVVAEQESYGDFNVIGCSRHKLCLGVAAYYRAAVTVRSGACFNRYGLLLKVILVDVVANPDL